MAVGSKLIGIGTGIAVRKISEKGLARVWQRTKHSDPPADPASPGTPWPEALSYAVASSARNCAACATARDSRAATRPGCWAGTSRR